MSNRKTSDALFLAFVILSLVLVGAVALPPVLARFRSARATSATSEKSEKPEKPPPAASGAKSAAARRVLPALSVEEARAAGLSLHEAAHWERLRDGSVVCGLCPHRCVIAPGERGICGVRMNVKGALKTLVYARPVALHVDPIEKKPLNHFLPGSRAFSIATAGCNLGCIFCQNWSISQARPEEARHYVLPPEKIVALALEQNCRSIAYTYTEPAIFYEYMRDCARLAHEKGLSNLMITCGYINPVPLRELCRYIDAANVDLKGFSEDFYAEYCNASLAPVLETLKILRKEGVWLEITNLIIPGANDDPRMIRDMCRWIVKNLGPDVPLHFSRFHPDYKLRDRPPTPVEALVKAKRIAEEEGIRYVFVGNVYVKGAGDTVCPKCGKVLVTRYGYHIRAMHIKDGKCAWCGAPVAGVWVDEQVTRKDQQQRTKGRE